MGNGEKILMSINQKEKKQAKQALQEFFQSPDNPNEVTVLLEWNDLEKAKEFMNSDDLKQKMADAGVQGVNTTLFLNET